MYNGAENIMQSWKLDWGVKSTHTQPKIKKSYSVAAFYYNWIGLAFFVISQKYYV